MNIKEIYRIFRSGEHFIVLFTVSRTKHNSCEKIIFLHIILIRTVNAF